MFEACDAWTLLVDVPDISVYVSHMFIQMCGVSIDQTDKLTINYQQTNTEKTAKNDTTRQTTSKKET